MQLRQGFLEKRLWVLYVMLFVVFGVHETGAEERGAESRFIRGDGNDDGTIDASDVASLLRCMLHPEVAECPHCEDAADSNDDGQVDLSDVVFMLNYLYRAGASPAQPHPECGVDLTQDDLPPCTQALASCGRRGTPCKAEIQKILSKIRGPQQIKVGKTKEYCASVATICGSCWYQEKGRIALTKEKCEAELCFKWSYAPFPIPAVGMFPGVPPGNVDLTQKDRNCSEKNECVKIKGTRVGFVKLFCDVTLTCKASDATCKNTTWGKIERVIGVVPED